MQEFLHPSSLVRRAEIAVKLRCEPTVMMWETLHPSLVYQRRVICRVSTWSWAECFAELSSMLYQLLYLQRLAGPVGTCRARHNSPVAAAAAFHALPKASTAPPGSGDLQSSSATQKPRHCKRHATSCNNIYGSYKYIQIVPRLKTELWFSFKQFQTVRFQHRKKKRQLA